MHLKCLLLFAIALALAAGPQTKPADPPAGTPKEALHSLNLAQRDGDAAAIRALFYSKDERGEQLVSAMADYAAAFAQLHAAAEHAYGAEGAVILTGDVQAESAKGLAAIEKATVTLDGNNATVKYEGATDAPIRLTKIDGRWKLPVSQLLDGTDEKAGEKGVKELLAEGQIARTMAEEITAGKYKEGANKAKEVWRSRLLAPGKTEKK
ncbi:MAG TPA: hypothetical protein VFE47_00910 [Tepidisphaeraceae bacterium]|jgi:hypothetical protein|nr:hypothetical protein [Tepidisphaeraceae bacterium]